MVPYFGSVKYAIQKGAELSDAAEKEDLRAVGLVLLEILIGDANVFKEIIPPPKDEESDEDIFASDEDDEKKENDGEDSEGKKSDKDDEEPEPVVPAWDPKEPLKGLSNVD